MKVCPSCGRDLPSESVAFEDLLALSSTWSSDEKRDWLCYLSARQTKYNDLIQAEEDMLRILTAKQNLGHAGE